MSRSDREKAAMRRTLTATLLVFMSFAAGQERAPSVPEAQVYIISPQHGETVRSPFTVRFGLKGMGIAPAGVKYDGAGHHHLLVDTDPPADLRLPLPATEQVLHFGKGQTETTLTLPPGRHSLQLVLADHTHVPHDPPLLSAKITVIVVE
jgi:hypothetical protein